VASRPTLSVVGTSRDAPLRLGRDVTWKDFPRGFAETRDIPPLCLLAFDHEEIFDVGMDHYGEFITSIEYGWDLLHRESVSLNGEAGSVSVAERFQNAVQLKWSPDTPLPKRRANMVHIGGEGFGYEWDGERWARRDHPFTVKIGKGVDIGEGTVIHRGRWRDTVVGDGTKIDALVFVAHNVHVGQHCLLVAGCKLAGSVTVGDHVIVGLGALVTPGKTIGDRAIIGAGAVVTKDVPAGQVWAGTPARYMRDRRDGETL